jgi:hypothetical protein
MLTRAQGRRHPEQGELKADFSHLGATIELKSAPSSLSRSPTPRDALQLLSMLAAYGPGRLPLPVSEGGWKGAQSVSPRTGDDDDAIQLTLWHVSHLPPLVQANSKTWDSFRPIEAVSLLKAFSLVSTDTDSGFLSISMHPLTHAWARDRQAATEQHESWVKAGCLIAISCGDVTQCSRTEIVPGNDGGCEGITAIAGEKRV